MILVPLASLFRKSSTLERVRLIGDDGKAVIVHVEDQILAHDGQANDCNIRCRFHNNLRFWREKWGVRYKSTRSTPEFF